jgi:non-specific serine/threonine protein kinase
MIGTDTVLGGVYRLEKMLGKGGMGEVWLAQHLLLNEPRAIKLMLSGFEGESTLRERFIQGEARNALRLAHHPNIVRVYELGLHENMPYIVMEYVEGGSSGSNLRDLLKNKGKLSVEETGAILNQLASALEVAHRQGMIHRDIKPGNILFDRQGQAKLSDFGLTKDLEADLELTSTGFSMGSPAYMAPEQAQGMAERGSDIYSLGVVIYEMLTGQPPFSGTAYSLITQHNSAQPSSPQQLEPSVPAGVAEVILKTLAKTPQNRYPSALALAEAYQQALDYSKKFQYGGSTIEEATHALPTLPSSVISQPGTAAQKSVAAPEAKSAPPARVTPNNLPVQLTSFIGREAEQAQAKLLLQNTRLLTLTGAGGTGKTRLSIEVAGALLDNFSDGVWFVELAPLTDAALVPQTAASAAGVREETGRPILATLTDYLRDKQVLLILDNCEHMVLACAKLAESLLRACPKLRILASSREGLGIGGETTWRVPSLGLPPITLGSDLRRPEALQELTQYEAVRLFIDRATSAKPDFQVTNQNAPAIAQLCLQLDGIPLALELAAVRVKAMTVDQIASRLDNRFRLLTGGSRTALPRQQTLRALIDWSYDMLPEGERFMLQRISVFAGGCSLEAAEAVCAGEYEGGEILDFEVMDVLLQLVNKSLVIAEEHDGENRYTMLESIRQYAREKLAESNQDQAPWERHCAYFLELAEKAEPQLMQAQQAEWLSRLKTEHDNLRNALNWAIEAATQGRRLSGDANSMPEPAEAALRMAAALWRFWSVSGYFSEGFKLCEAALTIPNMGSVSPAIRAKFLKSAGTLSFLYGNPQLARQQYNESLALLREQGDTAGVAALLSNLGVVAREEGDHDTARQLYEESLAHFRQMGNKLAIAQVLNNLGLVARDQGDYQAARNFLEESLSLHRALKSKIGISETLDSLGDVALDQGDYEAAQTYLKEGLAINQELNDRRQIVHLLEYFGSLASARALSEQSARLVGAAAAIRETLGVPLSIAQRQVLERRIAPAKQILGDSAWQVAWEEGYNMSFEQAIKSTQQI